MLRDGIQNRILTQMFTSEVVELLTLETAELIAVFKASACATAEKEYNKDKYKVLRNILRKERRCC